MTYMPGVARQAYGINLDRKVQRTLEDQARKASELKKYMSRRGALSNLGGKLGSLGAKALLGSTLGPVGLMFGQAAGAGIGSLLGGSELLGGKKPTVSPNTTGLLGSGYTGMQEALSGLDESLEGKALGAAGAHMKAGLLGAAGSQMGDFLKNTKLGVRLGELHSDHGKMIADKFGKNIGNQMPQAPELSKMPSDMGHYENIFGETQLPYTGISPQDYFKSQYQMDEAIGPISSNQESFIGPIPTGQESFIGPMPLASQEGGYLPQYQMGGMPPVSNPIPYQEGGYSGIMNMLYKRKLDKIKKDSPSLASWLDNTGPNKRKAEDVHIQGVTHNVQSQLNDKVLEDYSTNKNFEEYLSEGTGYTGAKFADIQKSGPKKGYEEQFFQDPESGKVYSFGKKHHGGLLSKLKNLYSDLPREVESMPVFENTTSYQDGGMIPKYNLGGLINQQPIAYQLGGLLKYQKSPSI